MTVTAVLARSESATLHGGYEKRCVLLLALSDY